MQYIGPAVALASIALSLNKLPAAHAADGPSNLQESSIQDRRPFDIEALCKQISLQLIDFSEIPRDVCSDPTVLCAALKSPRTYPHAIRFIEPHMLNIDEVRKVFIEVLTKDVFNENEGNLQKCFDRQDVQADVVAFAKAAPKTGRFPIFLFISFSNVASPAALDSVGAKLEEFTLQVLDAESRKPVKDRILSDGTITDNDPFTTAVLDTPSFLKSRTNVANAIISEIALHPTTDRIMILRGLAKEHAEKVSAASQTIMQQHPELLASLIKLVPDEILFGELRPEIIRLIRSHDRTAIRSLPLHAFDYPDIADEIRKALLSDVKLFTTFNHELQLGTPSQIRQYLQEALAQPETRKQILDHVGYSFDKLLQYPAEVLDNPHIAFAIRERVNQCVTWGSRGYEQRSAFISLLLSRGNRMPDFLHLARSERVSWSSKRTFPTVIVPQTAITINPGFFYRYIGEAEGISGASEWANANAIGDILGIHGFLRFDNFPELVRNRYRTSQPEVRAKLDPLQKFTETLKYDSRPICVAIYPKETNDSNGAFEQYQTLDPKCDNIDRLTAAYQVHYFEAESSHGGIDAVIRTAKVLGKKVELLLIAGHGTTQGISLGWNWDFGAEDSGSLNVHNQDLLRELRQSLVPGCPIVLMSCSTGKPVLGGTNISEVMHEAVPDSTLYAPSSDCNGFINLNGDGKFEGVTYIRANAIVLKPDGSVETISGRGFFGLLATRTLPIISRFLHKDWSDQVIPFTSFVGAIVTIRKTRELAGILLKRSYALGIRIFGRRRYPEITTQSEK